MGFQIDELGLTEAKPKLTANKRAAAQKGVSCVSDHLWWGETLPADVAG